MVRWIPTAFLLILITAPASAENPGFSLPPLATSPQASRNFDLPDEPGRAAPAHGSRILAGTQLSPNAMVGFGLFGEKAERSPHARATIRDYSLRRTRKAAVGFSLRF